MRTFARLSLICGDLEGSLLAGLVRILPEGQRGGVFDANLLADDPRMTLMLELLGQHGYHPWNRCSAMDRSREFSLALTREYSAEDLRATDYLLVSPTVPEMVDGSSPRPNSPEVILYQAPTVDIVWVGAGASTVVSAKVHKALLSGGFSNLIWKQAKLRPSGTHPDERRTDYQKKINPPKRGPWWELRSELVLPPLAPSMPLFHTDLTPFTGDFSKGCWRRDGLYTLAELRYRASDLKEFGPFDLAHTYETFGPRPTDPGRPLVASQRFYQYCLKHKIETSWQPVRVEE